MKSLVELAFAVQEKGVSAGDVSELVAKSMKQHQAKKEEEACDDIVALLSKIDRRKLNDRTEVRRLRAQANSIVKRMGELDRAWAYAQSSNNFLPVLALFGEVTSHDMPDPQQFSEMTTVPADFVVDPEGEE